MKEREFKVYKLHLELNTDGADIETLKKYGRVKKGITRDILVPSDATLHSLHYIIQRAFGWQNSHLHHFELPKDLFTYLTDNNFYKWSDLCGIYFRYPNAEMEDLYWDDDYYGDVSIKTWFKRKYTGLHQYCGISEKMMEARCAIEHFIEENPTVPVMPKFEEFMKMSDEEKSIQRIKDIKEVTCDEINMSFESGSTNELLERLKISEVLTDNDVKEYPKAFIKETLERCDKNINAFIVAHNDMINDKSNDYFDIMNQMNGRALPITKSLVYKYDYGDGWEVKITLEDIYHCDTSWDHPDKEGFVLLSLSDEQVYDDITPMYRNGEIVEGKLFEQICLTLSKLKPLCIEADGLPVLDDVGGIGGYCGLLKSINGEDCGGYPYENAEESIEWAKGLGWTGRMNVPEKIL